MSSDRDEDICSHPVTSNCNHQSPGAPVYILSGGNCFPDQRGPDNNHNYTQQHFGQKPFTPVASLKWPCAHWPYLPLIIIGWVPHGDTLISAHCYRLITISVPCFDNIKLMMSEMRWPAPFIWTMHVDDEDPGSIKVLLINSILQIKILLTVSFSSGHVFMFTAVSDQSAILILCQRVPRHPRSPDNPHTNITSSWGHALCVSPRSICHYHMSPDEPWHPDDDGLLLRGLRSLW